MKTKGKKSQTEFFALLALILCKAQSRAYFSLRFSRRVLLSFLSFFLHSYAHREVLFSGFLRCSFTLRTSRVASLPVCALYCYMLYYDILRVINVSPLFLFPSRSPLVTPRPLAAWRSYRGRFSLAHFTVTEMAGAKRSSCASRLAVRSRSSLSYFLQLFSAFVKS